MNKNGILKNFFTANIPYKDGVTYRRIIMINSMLLLSAFFFFAFAYINYFVILDSTVALLDTLAGLFSIATLIHLRRFKKIQTTAFLTIVILIFFMISFIIKNQNSHFGIIWSYYIPLFAILFNGKKVGLQLTLFYFIIIFTLAYLGIGTWNEGEWSFIDFIRFVASSAMFAYIIYTTESAHENADHELKLIRKHEAEILDKLQKQAITDGLTGMYNRRHFNEVVPKLLAIAQREESYISLFILDIDYFKNYNDYYGHQKGDTTLQKIAKELIRFIQRDDDFVFRIGGEEFAGLIHTRNKDESEEWISTLNAKIAALNIQHKKTLLPNKIVTVSIGVCTTKVVQGRDIDYFYKKADEALYKAKERGRNTTVMVH